MWKGGDHRESRNARHPKLVLPCPALQRALSRQSSLESLSWAGGLCPEIPWAVGGLNPAECFQGEAKGAAFSWAPIL